MTRLAAYGVRLLSVNLYGNQETYMWTLSLATRQFSTDTFHHTHSNGHSHGPLLANSLSLLKWLLSSVSGNHELASGPEYSPGWVRL